MSDRLPTMRSLFTTTPKSPRSLGNSGRVTGVRTSTGKVLQCDMVAVGIGVKARTELAQGAGLKTERGILVNQYLETSATDVYAAGDAAQIYDPIERPLFH